MSKLTFRCYDSDLNMMSKPFGFSSSVINFKDKYMKSYNPDIHTICPFYMELQTYKQDGPETIDVYEGDIIEVERYRDGEFYYVFIKDIRDRQDLLFGSTVVTRKLLGNIYENPELIEKYQLNID